MLIATASPTPTPAPTLASAYGLVQPRQTNYLDYSYDANCYNFNDGLQCTSILSGCYSDILTATDYLSAETACFCTYGISYLDCFYSHIATGSCASYFFGTEGYGDYQMSYYSSYCGSIPPSVMAQIQAPTSVSLELETVDVVRATGAIQQPNYAGQPNYVGTGGLLEGPCSNTGFTQVDAGSTVYYGGFVGCVMDRPECCPWTVATPAATSAAGIDAAINFPQPANGDMGVPKCADDYYSISGGCCPTGYWPFTEKVGGVTPCWSSVRSVNPPTLTLASDATTKEKPTSAVINIVWAMRYPVADPGGGGLSTAAKAGIGAGAGVAAILIAGLGICLWRYRRKNKKLAETQQPAAPVQPQSPPPPQTQYVQYYQPQQAQPKLPQMQQTVAPNGQYPPGGFHPGMGGPSPSDGTSVLTSTTPVSAAALIPQNTGTSNGGVSELSSLSGQNLLHHSQQPGAGGYFAGAAAAAAANPRGSYGNGGSSGTGSPAVGGAAGNNGQGGYPAPIAEADEGQWNGQYGYQQHQQQQHQQQYYGAPPVQEMPPQNNHGQGHEQGQYYSPHPQGGDGYAHPSPQQHQQHQQGYSQTNVPEMSAGREADPPQEIMGTQVQHEQQQQHYHAG